jgi:hypothetical protein
MIVEPVIDDLQLPASIDVWIYIYIYIINTF